MSRLSLSTPIASVNGDEKATPKEKSAKELALNKQYKSKEETSKTVTNSISRNVRNTGHPRDLSIFSNSEFPLRDLPIRHCAVLGESGSGEFAVRNHRL